MRRPSRARGRRYGALLIDSMPPATAISISPSAMPCAASMTAFKPEPQTLLMVSAATSLLNPPASAACRAGACPTPADNTLPIMHSSTRAGSMPARVTASRTAIAPNCGACRAFNDPRNFPEGVRTALMMTGVCISFDDDASDAVVAQQSYESRENHRRRPLQFFIPPLIDGLHFDHPLRLQANGRHACQRVPNRDTPRDFQLALRHRPVPKQLGEGARHDGMQ